jgi:hypothetical protein
MLSTKIKIVGQLTPSNRIEFSLLLEDGQDLLTLIPISRIDIHGGPGLLPEVELRLAAAVIEFDLLATVGLEDIVRQLREIESKKHEQDQVKG